MNLWKSIATRMGLWRQAAKDELKEEPLPHDRQLELLSFFLTGDKTMAVACVVNATRLVSSLPDPKFEEWLERWGRRATIRSAITQQQPRILQLGRAYDKVACPHREHKPLTLRQIVLGRRVIDSAVTRMDLLCRMTLLLRGVERDSSSQVARMLGISSRAVDAAYCAGLEGLQILTSELEKDPLHFATGPSPLIMSGSEKVRRRNPFRFVKTLITQTLHEPLYSPIRVSPRMQHCDQQAREPGARARLILIHSAAKK